MNDLVIETRGLRKEFRTRRGRHVIAVEGLDLTVPQGGVHGFLGPNGSGKTTTLRMLLGLASASAGEMRLFGEPVPRRLPQLMDRIGAVVEQPKFLPTLTGRRNLTLLARTVGAPASSVDDALDRVGLTGRGSDRFRSYSLGMKQRLAIAATLLKQPELLILDEPSNGLDPAGIRDVRHLVRELAGEGTTVLLSSHILAEVQQVCDSVSIIDGGRLLSEGRVDELVGSEQSDGVRLKVADLENAARVLRQAGLRVAPDGGGLYVEAVGDPADVTRLLAAEGLYVRELVPERPDLEQVFLRLTSGDAGGQA
ncbi:MAG TPA: ABC transporter ATP-binding protein [Marmoricola sp.]|nr:ABC transporter ATP-binding protein [Marmoricola sp.]